MEKERVGLKEKIFYGFGDFSSNLFWMTFVFYGTFFYTDIFGLPASVVGTMFLVTKLWDAVNDPIMGIIADRTKTKWGKYRPYILWLAIPFGVIGTAAFTTPNFGMTGKIIYAYVTYTLMMMCYTAINIPYSSLMGVITPSSKERTKISSIRFAFAFSGGVFIQFLTLPLLTMYGAGGNDVIQAEIIKEGTSQQVTITENGQGASRLNFTFIRTDIEGGSFLDVLTEGEKKKITMRKNVVINDKQMLSNLDTTYKKIINENASRTFLSNPEDRRLAFIKGFQSKKFDIAKLFPELNLSNMEIEVKTINQRKGYSRTVATYAIIAIIMFLLTFYGTKERVQPPKDQKTTIGKDIKDVIATKPWIIVALINFFSYICLCIRNGAIIYYFTYYLDKQLIAGSFMVTVSLFNIVGSLATDWLTKVMGGKKNVIAVTMIANAILLSFFLFLPPNTIFLMFVLQMLIGLVTGPQAVITWAMYADTADYSEWKNGTRATGLFFSASTFAQKFGITIGGAMLGWLLSLFGYKAGVEQTESAILGIKLLMSIIPAAASLITAILVFFYKLDSDFMEKIGNELEERRDKEEGELSAGDRA